MRVVGVLAVAGTSAFGASCSDDGPAGARIGSPEVVTATPLADAIGYDPLVGEWRQAAFADALARCMRDQGYEYVAFVAQPKPRGAHADVVGYGITVLYLADPPQPPSAGPVDPNEVLAAQLDPASLAAYELALWGPPERAGESPLSIADRGCNRQTQIEFYGFDGAAPDVLQQALDDIDRRARASDPYLAAENDWAVCLRERGYEYDHLHEPEQQLRWRVDDVTGTVRTADGFGVGDASDQEALQALLAEEVELAAADFACREAAGIEAVYLGQVVEAEAAFLHDDPEFPEDLAVASSSLGT